VREIQLARARFSSRKEEKIRKTRANDGTAEGRGGEARTTNGTVADAMIAIYHSIF